MNLVHKQFVNISETKRLHKVLTDQADMQYTINKTNVVHLLLAKIGNWWKCIYALSLADTPTL